MKIIIKVLVIILFFTTNINAQSAVKRFETDYIINSKGLKLNCKIVKIKNGRLKYRLYKQSQPFIVRLDELSDFHAKDWEGLEKSLPTSIEKPQSGFAHVYFYCVEKPSAQVFYKDKKLVKIRKNSYYLHKIKTGQEHVYGCKKNNEKEKIRLNPKSGEIFFMRPIYIGYGGYTLVKDGIATTYTGRIQHALSLDNSKTSKYTVMSIDKLINDN